MMTKTKALLAEIPRDKERIKSTHLHKRMTRQIFACSQHINQPGRQIDPGSLISYLVPSGCHCKFLRDIRREPPGRDDGHTDRQTAWTAARDVRDPVPPTRPLPAQRHWRRYSTHQHRLLPAKVDLTSTLASTLTQPLPTMTKHFCLHRDLRSDARKAKKRKKKNEDAAEEKQANKQKQDETRSPAKSARRSSLAASI